MPFLAPGPRCVAVAYLGQPFEVKENIQERSYSQSHFVHCKDSRHFGSWKQQKVDKLLATLTSSELLSAVRNSDLYILLYLSSSLSSLQSILDKVLIYFAQLILFSGPPMLVEVLV